MSRMLGSPASLMLSSASVMRAEMALQVAVSASPVASRRRLSTLATWPWVSFEVVAEGGGELRVG